MKTERIHPFLSERVVLNLFESENADDVIMLTFQQIAQKLGIPADPVLDEKKELAPKAGKARWELTRLVDQLALNSNFLNVAIDEKQKPHSRLYYLGKTPPHLINSLKKRHPHLKFLTKKELRTRPLIRPID